MKRKTEKITFRDFAGIDFGEGEIQYHQGYVLYVVWNSGIRLEVISQPYYQYLSIFKEDVCLYSLRSSQKEEFLSYVKNTIRDINAGKFRNKKSLREQAFQIVQERNLTSYMNNTKWRKFLKIVMGKLPFQPDYVYKLLSDSPDRSDIQPFRNIPRGQGCYCGECFNYYRFYEIEWVRITPKYAVNHGGRLVENLEVFDETEELIQELENAHIPFEKDNQDIVIYGYR